MIIEEWKVIKGFSNYSISNIGNIKNNVTNKKLKPYKNKGYLRLGIYNDDGIRKNVFVHRIVALHFVDNPNPELFTIVNHKDENPSNPCYLNLEWCDYRYNSNYGNAPNKRSEANRRGKHHSAKKTICEDIVFDCSRDCEEYYNLPINSMKDWLSGKSKMPQEWYEKGLRHLDVPIENYSVQKNTVKVIFKGITYKSVREFCRENNLDRNLVRKWQTGKLEPSENYKGLIFKE